MRIFFRALVLVAALPFVVPYAPAADEAAQSERTERMVNLCKVWGTVRYFHPYLAYKDIDWDAALVEALPKVQAAKAESEYRSDRKSVV